MTKVLRLHQSGNNNIEGWGDSQKYGSRVIDEIVEPNVNNTSRPITSIPSPFARMDLVRSAFNFAAYKDQNGRYPNIELNTIYNKMVSDTLDIGQIFFHYDSLRERNLVEIIAWDKNTDLLELLNSRDASHKQLGETYRLFLNQDGAQLNFDKMNKIFLLNYKAGTNSGVNIIGATSPCTLFFSSANDLSYVSQNIVFNDDRPFDNSFLPLYKRELEYHKYLYALKHTQDFARLFPEINAYLDACFSMSDYARQNSLRDIDNNTLNNYNLISVNGISGYNVEIINGIYPRQASEGNGIVNPQDTSDFVINSNSPNKPLVLPVGTFTDTKFYVDSIWNSNTIVPYKNKTPWKDRRLPNTIISYPYLTISDFISDVILFSEYPMNNIAFFTGTNTATGTYLLPLTPLFFEFFSVNDLSGTVAPSKNMLEIQENSNDVVVKLRIPIKSGYIEYQRIYYKDSSPRVDENNNDGGVVKLHSDFAFAMTPLIKFPSPQMASYRYIIQTHLNRDTNRYRLDCYKSINGQGQPAQKCNLLGPIIRNDKDSRYNSCMTYIHNGDSMDYLYLTVNDNFHGVIVPNLEDRAPVNNFTFAIDFGTTNTHIEYYVGTDSPKPLEISSETECQIQCLSVYPSLQQYYFDYDFIPKQIGENKEFSFPIRTAMSYGKVVDWRQSVVTMASTNIPFPYGRRREYDYNEYLTNLKWTTEPDYQQKVESYMGDLLWIIRNKVLLNGGNLATTKIIWFYPIAMTLHRYDMFATAWRKLYTEFFGSRDNINDFVIPVTESVAPYTYYRGANMQGAEAVTIDIGGGTSDVVFADNDGVKSISSFRFAANSVFGDGYRDIVGNLNGIIDGFKEEIYKILNANELADAANVFKKLEEKKNSADFASFLFSLKDSKEVQEKNIQNNLDFNQTLLNDGKYKIVILLFYISIIYHVASISKAQGYRMPRFISFSGNGSKIIDTITADLKILAKFSKLIYTKVYGVNQYGADDLTILHDTHNPKVATCKGGLIESQPEDYLEMAERKVILNSSDNSSFVQNGFTYANIDDSYIANTVLQTQEFLDFAFSLNEECSFKTYFGIEDSSLRLAKKECYKDLEIHTHSGLARKRKEVTDNDQVEETLFFYPLIGMLYNLSDELKNN